MEKRVEIALKLTPFLKTMANKVESGKSTGGGKVLTNLSKPIEGVKKVPSNLTEPIEPVDAR